MLTRRAIISCLTATAVMPRAALSQQVSTVVVPLRFGNGRVLIDISLNGGPTLPFLLDTGGIISLIKRDVAREAGLTQLGVLRLGTVGGYGGLDPREGYEAREIVIGGIARRGPVQFAGVDPQQIGGGASGSIDGEVLTAYDSLLSFGDSRWTIFLAGLPDRTGFVRVSSSINQPAKRGSPFLYVDAELNGHPLRLLVDTGAPRSIILQSNAAKRTGLLNESRPWTPWRVRPGTLPGAVGRETRGDNFVIAGQSFSSPIVSLRSNPPNHDLADGLLGLGIIQRLDWVIDRKAGALWIKPNSRETPMQQYNRSGLWLDQEPAGASVADVGFGSPAARAGIKRGDHIVGSSYAALQQAIAGPVGRTIEFDIVRNGNTSRSTIVLADFL